jgi:ketosteroid isomerase-like protein
MPDRARVKDFIRTVESGDHVGAIERFYTDDASMQENSNPPRVRRTVLMAHERAVLARMTMQTQQVQTFLVDGDDVVINWIFLMTDASGKTRRLDELALQHWRGDHIFRERFFYDAPKPVED